MEKENGFDSDSSDSWSFIDMDNEWSSDIKIRDKTKPKGDIIPDNSAALPGEGVKNELPETSPIIDLNVASSFDNLNSPQDFQVLYKSKIFGDDNDLNIKIELNSSESNLRENANMNSEKKDLEEDSDGISVISESEYNDIKGNTYESDEVGDEKLSDSDGTEKPEPDTLGKKRKLHELNSQESSEESMNGDVVTDENSKGVDVKKIENPPQKKQCESVPVYRHDRNNVANSALTVILCILFTGVACIAVGHFIGVKDSQDLVHQMVQTLKKVQMENILLHTRLTQLNRDMYDREAEKPEVKEEKVQNNDDDNGSAYVSDTDDSTTDNGNYHDQDIDLGNNFIDCRRFIYYKGFEQPRDPIFIKKRTGSSKTFNISEFTENILKPLDDSNKNKYKIENIFLAKNIRKKPKIFKKSEKDKIIEPDKSKNEESDPSVVKPEVKNCQTDKSTAGNAEKGNCLAIGEKDLSQFRWFLLKIKAKSKELIEEDPLDYINTEENAENLDNSKKVPEKSSGSNKKDDITLPVLTEPDVGFLYLGESVGDGKIKNEVKPEENKKPDENEKVWKHYLTYDRNQDKTVKKGNKMKLVPLEEQQKLKGHFGNVADEIKQKNGKTKVCNKKTLKCDISKDDEITGEKPEGKTEKKMEKRAKDEKKFNDEKIGQSQNKKKDKATIQTEKLKPTIVKSSIKSGNESGFEEVNFKSGDWFTKWGEGREKNRRDQKISDWQFDRAKSRAQSRKGDAFWQFSRAYGRRTAGAYPFITKKKVQTPPPPPPPPRKVPKHHNGHSIRAYRWI